MNFKEFKDSLIGYLNELRQAIKEELKIIEDLSDVEKEQLGHAILHATVISINEDYIELLVDCNYTKWRTGDKIVCVCSNQKKFNSTVLENYNERVIVSKIDNISLGAKVNLYSSESELTGMIIEAINYVQEGGTGAEYLNILGGSSDPKISSPLPLNVDLEVYKNLNEKQQESVERIIRRPSIYAIQGPPGTGKTNVLSTIAYAFSKKGKSVLVLSNSHQAVNNALNKIAEKGILTYKIGSEYKTKALSDAVIPCKNIWDYKMRKRQNSRRKVNFGDVIGMTVYGAIINLIFHNSAYTPTIILVDEASQIPLAMGASIAKLGAGTIVFFGDDKQLPPIFPTKMEGNILSKSIFSHLQEILPISLKTTLTISYRMNKIICDYVSKRYYEPYNIRLSSFESISARHIVDEGLKDSIEVINIETEGYTDRNDIEAKKVVELVDKYLAKGLEVAVVSPYRKQVNCVKENWNNFSNRKILIDTVERLQGQDVDVIILTMACSDAYYYMLQNEFILNPNRMNVMISRAKQKVLIVKSPLVEIDING